MVERGEQIKNAVISATLVESIFLVAALETTATVNSELASREKLTGLEKWRNNQKSPSVGTFC